MSMITMLVVLGLIIGKASDPATWAWLADDQAAVKQTDKAALPPATPVTAQTWSETVTEGPTDEDIEERDGASEEFMALTDGALELGKEEMPAYWRLFRWTKNQSSAQLKKRATRDHVFNQFIRDPDEHRGHLFQIELNVRRVLAYDAPENKAGVKKVYEIWGFTTESQAWLYCVLTPELPAGMPMGSNVSEEATFVGYFLKLQGYHAAGAGPRDRALTAPLFVGRIAWQPSAHDAQRAQSDFDWLVRHSRQPGSWIVRGIFAAGVLGIIALGFWLVGFLQPRRAVQAAVTDFESTRKAADVRNWLSDAESDTNVSGDDPAKLNGASSRPGKLPDFHSN
jgi:hypothetical protein